LNKGSVFLYKKIKILIVLFSLILLITGCSNDLPGTDSNIEDTEMISGTLLGNINNANIPLSNRQSLINDTVVTTDNNGSFTLSSNSASNSTQNVSTLSNSNEITIETQGFNKYYDSNWYEGKEARLIPYLVVAEVNHQTPATYQHAFKYLLSNSYNNTDYPNDGITFYHQKSNLTYELRYRETDRGYKDFANKKEDWSTIENIATGKWVYEGTIEGNEVSGQFIVDMPEELIQVNPKIISYELNETVIRVYYDINHTVDKAYIRTDDTFYEIPDPNSSVDYIDIPYEELNIDKSTTEPINIYIQPANVNNLQFGYEIKSKGVIL
jgi:hypothetical protein